MIIEIILNTAQLSTNQVLVLSTPSTPSSSTPSSPVTQGRKIKVESKSSPATTTTTSSNPSSSSTNKPNVVLERWKISFLPFTSSSSSSSSPSNQSTNPTIDDKETNKISSTLPQLYKSTIIQFRTLFTLIHLLPCFNQLFKSIAPPSSTTTTSNTRPTMRRGSNFLGLRIDSRLIVDSGEAEVVRRESEIGLNEPIVEVETTEAGASDLRNITTEKEKEKVTETIKLEKVWTPFG